MSKHITQWLITPLLPKLNTGRGCRICTATPHPKCGVFLLHYIPDKVQHITSYHTRLIFSYCYLAVAHQAISSPFVVSGLRRKPLATQLNIFIRLPEIVLRKIRTRLPNMAGSPTMRQNITCGLTYTHHLR